ncbi:TPA: hypothetical protein HA241_03305, partial [Candidatus Woesearchaeota archaeon]|nr:hypothetical protein [Candidatus Woesearchaeota archaeon]
MQLTLYMTSTLNGYIATENDDTPWSTAVWKSYYTIAKKFNAIILGRRTYEMMKEVNELEKMGNPFTIVVSTTKSPLHSNVIFVMSPKEAVKVIKEKNITNALIGGGGKLNASFMKQNLIDKLGFVEKFE